MPVVDEKDVTYTYGDGPVQPVHPPPPAPPHEDWIAPVAGVGTVGLALAITIILAIRTRR